MRPRRDDRHTFLLGAGSRCPGHFSACEALTAARAVGLSMD